MSANPIRLLLADDHLLVRVGLRTLLQQFPELEVVGEADTVAKTIEECLRLEPDVVLLDLRLSDGSGLEACRKIRAASDRIRFLVLTSFGDDDSILEAIAAGVDGYLLKEIGAEKLVRAVQRIMAGETVADQALTDRLFRRLKQLSGAARRGAVQMLSNQERRILQGVAEGKTNKQIAQELGLSDKTIKNYLSNVFEKLNINRRSQAAALFIQSKGENGT